MSGRNRSGYVYGVAAAVSCGLSPVFALPLLRSGMDVVSILFWRYLIALPAVWLLMRLRGRHAEIGISRILPLCGLGLVMIMSSMALLSSYPVLGIGTASTFMYLYPLMVMLIMVGFFNEIMLFRTFVCVLGALAGVWLACSELTIGSFSIRGAVWVMLAALAYAIYVVFINRRPIKSVATLSQTFWTLISGMAVLAVAVCVCGLDLPGGWFEWGAVVLLALVPTLLTFLATSAAVERVGIVRTAELGVFEPVTSVVFGIILFDERFSLRLLIAALLVLVCVTMVIANGNLTRQVLAIRKLFPVFRRHQHRGGHRH